ncbi:MAG TPA: hypothetical protein VG672_30180 [Bryobacteraceae bacterium]|jgi:hypothetical protein|nr:hypothetical protein [Bryobacteraceae bacterium]
MSLTPLTPPFDTLAVRPFSFYPAILNIEHNEWLVRKSTWSEILVYNTKMDLEIWIPRRFLGEISSVDDPVLIVGLVKELEYKGGTVWPYQRRVIQMPVAVNAPVSAPAPVDRSEPAPVIGIRVASATDSRILKLIGTVMVVGVLSFFLVWNFYREGVLKPRVNYTMRDTDYLSLTARDDYWGVVQKLGQPAQDHWRSEAGEIQYRALYYPSRSYIVILMGTDRRSVTYIGTLDQDWNPVHSVQYRSGTTTFSMLRSLKRF